MSSRVFIAENILYFKDGIFYDIMIYINVIVYIDRVELQQIYLDFELKWKHPAIKSHLTDN